MRLLLCISALLLLIACDKTPEKLTASKLSGAQELDFPYTETFKVFEHDGYHVIDMSASIVNWVGAAEGERQTARLVLVPKGKTPPALKGELSGATLIRTPLARIAVNYGSLEAIVSALGLADKLVAVGGTKSYNDEIRQGVKEGRIAQIGYGWHMPPMLDPLILSKPEALLMVMGDLKHAESYQRISELGIPVIPIFLSSESNYLAAVDYARLIGLLTGAQDKAERHAELVRNNVNRLKQLVSTKPKKTLLNAWYAGSGKWMAVVRNKDNQFITDANGINPLATEDDIEKSSLAPFSTEFLLTHLEEIDCWVIRDSHSMKFDGLDLIRQFKAVQNQCLFAADGKQKPEFDAFDIYETAVIRPDLILQDYVKLLYPELVKEPHIYIQPDTMHRTK